VVLSGAMHRMDCARSSHVCRLLIRIPDSSAVVEMVAGRADPGTVVPVIP